MKIQLEKASESYIVGVLLAVAGGFLDVYTYISRGGVFANAQTGNIVLLGISAADGNWKQIMSYVWPILAFMAGILLTEAVRKKYRYNPGLHWRQIVIGLEFLVLLCIAFVPSGRLNDLVNVLVSFVCSMQVESFRLLHGNAYATTMCTGNLRSGTEALYHGAVNHDPALLRRSGCYFGVILCFLLGAALGCRMAPLFPQQAVLAAALFQLAAFALMCAVDAA